jgi:hypothetical protein
MSDVDPRSVMWVLRILAAEVYDWLPISVSRSICELGEAWGRCHPQGRLCSRVACHSKRPVWCRVRTSETEHLTRPQRARRDAPEGDHKRSPRWKLSPTKGCSRATTDECAGPRESGARPADRSTSRPCVPVAVFSVARTPHAPAAIASVRCFVSFRAQTVWDVQGPPFLLRLISSRIRNRKLCNRQLNCWAQAPHRFCWSLTTSF